MRILYLPQVDEERKDLLTYSFSGEVITVNFDEESETYDFTNLPDGRLENTPIEGTTGAGDLVFEAERVEGVLSVKLLKFIAKDAPEEEKFPEWMEV
jgi:hypothetical protein